MRNHPAALSPRIKSLNYLNNILAKIEGLQAGCIEALMLNHKGEVAECTGDNIFLVRGGILLTPPNDAGILEGITRAAVIELAESGIEVREMPLTRHDVYIADECFLTGTAAEVIPVVRVDSRVIGAGTPGPITRELKVQFHKLARSLSGRTVRAPPLAAAGSWAAPCHASAWPWHAATALAVDRKRGGHGRSHRRGGSQ